MHCFDLPPFAVRALAKLNILSKASLDPVADDAGRDLLALTASGTNESLDNICSCLTTGNALIRYSCSSCSCTTDGEVKMDEFERVVSELL